MLYSSDRVQSVRHYHGYFIRFASPVDGQPLVERLPMVMKSTSDKLVEYAFRQRLMYRNDYHSWSRLLLITDAAPEFLRLRDCTMPTGQILDGSDVPVFAGPISQESYQAWSASMTKPYTDDVTGDGRWNWREIVLVK